MTQNDLSKLGPCLTSVLPTEYLVSMNPSVFAEHYRTLNNIFQPDASQLSIAMNLTSSFANNNTLNKSQDILLFSRLNNLALFYPFNSTIASNISSDKVILINKKIINIIKYNCFISGKKLVVHCMIN